MEGNQDTGRKSVNWRPSFMHWINLSEKPGMNFLRFCSPTHPASTEKVSRGYKRQVLRGDTANNFSQFVSELGIVGNKSTHAEDTQQSLAMCDLVSWVIRKPHNSLDKSRPDYDPQKNSKTIYPSISARHTPRETPHTRCNPNTQHDTPTKPTALSGLSGFGYFGSGVGLATQSLTHTHRIHTTYTNTRER